MRYLRYLFLACLAVVLITVSLANRDALTLQLLPDDLSRLLGFNFDITLPAFMILLGAVLLGVLLGFIWEWLREHKHRVTAATEMKERVRLEQEVRKVAPSSEKGDDVLALLEGN